MRDDEYSKLKSISKPIALHKLTETSGRSYEVGIGPHDWVLFAAEVTQDGRLIEWMPNHPFVDGFKRKIPATYILGPV